MAIKFFKSIDLTNNELQNAKLHLTGTAPSALEGAIYFDTGDNKAKIYVNDGSPAWENIAFESWASGQFLPSTTTTITTAQANAITANSAKTSFPGFGTTSGTALEGDTALLQLGTTATTALAGNTTTVSTSQANAITANSAKTSFPGFGTTSGTALEGNTTTISTSQASAITANSAKVSFPGFGTTSSTALAGNTTVDDVSIALALAWKFL